MVEKLLLFSNVSTSTKEEKKNPTYIFIAKDIYTSNPRSKVKKKRKEKKKKKKTNETCLVY